MINTISADEVPPKIRAGAKIKKGVLYDAIGGVDTDIWKATLEHQKHRDRLKEIRLAKKRYHLDIKFYQEFDPPKAKKLMEDGFDSFYKKYSKRKERLS